MNSIIDLSPGYAASRPSEALVPSTARDGDTPTMRRSDEPIVDRAPRTRRVGDAVGLSSFQLARAQALRAAIAEGTFETAERLEGTLRRLFHVLS